MRAVNLLPRELQAKRGARRADPVLLTGGLFATIVLVALTAAFVSAHSRAGSEGQKLDAARAQLAQIEAQPVPTGKNTKPVVPVPAVTAQESPRAAAVTSVFLSRVAWDRVLREFSLVLPADVTVSSLAMSSPDAPTTTATSFELKGLTYSHDSVARLLARLMLIPDLTGVSLENSTADASTGEVSFTIQATVKSVSAAASPLSASGTPGAAS